uniref:hypothetical protein n=1 Tax=Nonomuraea bangladeshensis TaxID=404385 RepID=UPI003F497F51
MFLIARFGGLDAFGMFVVVQAIGIILSIPMMWGVHVNASRAMADRSDPGTVVGTALVVVALSVLLTSIAYLALLSLARGVLPVADPGLLPLAAGLGGSSALASLAESLLRMHGRQALASGLRLGSAAAYLLGVAIVLTGGQGDAACFAWLVIGTNTACAALTLLGLHRTARTRSTAGARAIGTIAAGRDGMLAGGPATGGRVLGWDAGLARILLREGRVYSAGQSLLNLLFGFDALLLMQASGPAAVAVYALYVGSCRRAIGVLFTDSLASLLVASLAQGGSNTGEPSVGGRSALRHAPKLLALAATAAGALVVGSLTAAGAVRHLVPGWVALTAVGCAAHALVIVLFCVLTVRPALGLARIRTALTATFLPGLALQAAGAALGGVPGMIAAFTVLNLALAWWFVAVIRRSSGSPDLWSLRRNH